MERYTRSSAPAVAQAQVERRKAVSFKDLFFKKVLIILAFVIGVAGAGFPLQRHSEKLQAQLDDLTKSNEALQLENSHLRYINSLSVEFSMDPMIVTLVDQYSRQQLKTEAAEWRLLKTPEFLTYIMLSLIYAESKGDPAAIGDGGRARGLTQIWVSTAKDYGNVSADQLLDPETNISYSFKHFHGLLKKYRGNLAMVLYAWNRGPGTVDRLLLYGQTPENGYGKKVYQASLDNNRKVVFSD
jgi:hypothetical protein